MVEGPRRTANGHQRVEFKRALVPPGTGILEATNKHEFIEGRESRDFQERTERGYWLILTDESACSVGHV